MRREMEVMVSRTLQLVVPEDTLCGMGWFVWYNICVPWQFCSLYCAKAMNYCTEVGSSKAAGSWRCLQTGLVSEGYSLTKLLWAAWARSKPQEEKQYLPIHTLLLHLLLIFIICCSFRPPSIFWISCSKSWIFQVVTLSFCCSTVYSKAGAGVQSVCASQLCATAAAGSVCGVKAAMPWFRAWLDTSHAFPTWEAL